ncbi:hypothetical protein XENOCAPTIV_023431 [Xenoophorus captivus]|uniref:Uncharacterized protein n=1 Tax=Xenoophorus captivus TaxID=1517983 RepID=A0ABV0RSI1_9TELE
MEIIGLMAIMHTQMVMEEVRMICLSPFHTDAELLAENWFWSFSEYSRLASFTALPNLYFASLYVSLSPLLKASSLSSLNLLSLAVNQGLSLL